MLFQAFVGCFCRGRLLLISAFPVIAVTVAGSRGTCVLCLRGVVVCITATSASELLVANQLQRACTASCLQIGILVLAKL